jgi:hypothetical protein
MFQMCACSDPHLLTLLLLSVLTCFFQYVCYHVFDYVFNIRFFSCSL